MKDIRIVYIFFGLVFFIIFLTYVWNFTVDDAFISFRYAEHLVQGYGLVWNIGEPPVEGYSNFLWVLILAVIYVFNLNPIISVKVVSLFSLMVIIYLYWKISKGVFQDQKILAYTGFGIGVLLLLINPATALHAVSGLETMAYSAAIFGLAYFTYKIITSGKTHFHWFFTATAIVSSLLRPEGILVSFGLFLFILIYSRKDKNALYLIIRAFIVYLVPLMLYMIFRISYFHEILPLPFYVKTISYGGFSNGIDLLIQVLTYILPFISIICIAAYLNFKLALKTKYKTFPILLIVTIITILIASIPYVYSAPLINYGQRFLYPSLVIIYIITGISFVIVFNELRIRILYKKLSNNYSRFLEFLIVFLLVASNMVFIADLTSYNSYAERIQVAHIALGKSLNPFSSDNYTIASVDAGTIPYFSEWKHLDIYGINDRFIAKNGNATKEYVEKKDPKLVIIVSKKEKELISRFDQQKPFLDFVQEKGYVRLPLIKYSDSYYLVPFLDPNIKDFDKISQALQEVSVNSFR